MTWEELVKQSIHYGWYLVEPKKEDVDLVCDGHEYKNFQLKYEPFLCHENSPIRFYKQYNSMFYDDNDVDMFPKLIQNEIKFEDMLELMKRIT